MTEQDEVKQNIQVIDKLIGVHKEMAEFMRGDRGEKLISDINGIRLSAIEDYLKDNTPHNQAQANVINTLYNLLITYSDETELANLIKERDTLNMHLQSLRSLESTYSSPQQRGGAL